MFAQVIQGKTSNPQAFDAAIKQWLRILHRARLGGLAAPAVSLKMAVPSRLFASSPRRMPAATAIARTGPVVVRDSEALRRRSHLPRQH